jgi:branched-chain amino acid transport system ATP-binding protein
LSGVTASYGSARALHGIDLDVKEGELVALIGANGAGKTTTLRVISGVVPLTAGDVEFRGRSLRGLPPKAIIRAGVAHCPEGRGVFPHMTVRENLELGAYVFGRPPGPRDFEQVYADFPILRERARQLAGTLSGGEQQMLAIGRALMARPRLMLLDEPSMGLAPLFVERVRAIVSHVHRAGQTLLLVEQNAFLALSLADRAYVLENGRVALTGTGQALLHDRHVRKAYLGIEA